MNRHFFCSLAILITGQLSASTDDVVYGVDNRQDAVLVTSPLFVELAESTAAMVPASRLILEAGKIRVEGVPLREMVPPEVSLPVCAKERFSAQPTAALCSGFLVGDDTLITAGHCAVSEGDCTDNKWVFNYKVSSAEDSTVQVAPEDVYSCSKIIKRGLGIGVDFAVIKLDRPIPGKGLKLATAVPEVGTPLVMIGHPSGLPQKISDGARVVSLLEQGFISDLDAFRGNSGSAVLNAATGELLGILVNGNHDYVDNFSLGCSEVNVLPDERAGEGVSSFLQFLPYL